MCRDYRFACLRVNGSMFRTFRDRSRSIPAKRCGAGPTAVSNPRRTAHRRLRDGIAMPPRSSSALSSTGLSSVCRPALTQTIRRSGNRSAMPSGRNTGTTRTTIRRCKRIWWHKGANMKRRNLLAGGAALAAIGPAGLARPAIAQNGSAKLLRFVPQANLANPDPIWTTATVAINHGYMVFDTLYGIDDAVESQPQMCAGHEVSSDELTWTFTLREGLLFHDNEPVRAIDCTASLTRWAAKDPFGQQLVSLIEEMQPLDDRRFQIRLKQPFRQMLYALGARNCFMMPQRMASTPPSEQIKEYIGSGPYHFLTSEWVSGASAAWAKFDKYVPRQEKPSYFSGGKVVNVDRVEWIVQPDPATSAAALQTGEV